MRRRLDNRNLDRIGHRSPLRRASRLRRPVEGLPADLHDTRHGRQGFALGDQHASVSDAEIVGWSLELRCRAAEATSVIKQAVDEQQ